jgi:thiamine-phosphate diphosphorylase
MMRDITRLHILVSGDRSVEIARLGDELGAAVIQLREKDKQVNEILRIADNLRATIKRAAFIVNDRADIAKAVGADGVHLGQDDLPIEHARAILGPEALIGVSTNSAQQATDAENRGANYVGFGHMYHTTSKRKETSPKSLEDLRAVTQAVKIPVIAIGGITTQNADAIIEAGASGIAVIGAIQHADDAAKIIRDFLRIIAQAKAGAARL